MKVCGIYKIQSKIKPERIYIGSALYMSKRWNEHSRKLRLNIHPNYKLQHHYNKYGKDDLQFSILIGCKKEDLIKHEQYFIDALNPWFNICPVAGNSMGRITTEETKEKIRKARKLQVMKPMSDETKIKIIKSRRENPNNIIRNKRQKGIHIAWNKGKKYHFHKKRDNSNSHGYQFTEEQKKAVSDRFKGRKLSSEAVEKIRKRMMGKKYALGAKRSEEIKKRISEGMKRLNKSGQGKRVINTSTGEVYGSIGIAAKSINMKYRTLHAQLVGDNPNKTNLRLVA